MSDTTMILNGCVCHAMRNVLAASQVLPTSEIVGRTVEGAGLRGLDGLYLTSVIRGETVARAIGRDFLLQAGDILLFTGEGDGMSVARVHAAQTISHDDERDGSGMDEGWTLGM